MIRLVMMRFIPSAYTSLILFVVILALSFGGAPVFGDPDTAWHLAAGDLIRDLHSVPLYDSWSYTADGERWYNLSWLFDVALSWLFSLGGFGALYVLTIGVFAGAITAMAHFCIRRGASITSVFLVIFLVLLVIHPGVLARPSMVSLVLTLTFYTLLHRYRDSGRLRDILILPLLMIVWVNLHGGFLFAFILLGLFLVEALWNGDHERRRGYGFIIALCLIAVLINPYNFSIYYGAYKTLSGTFDKFYLTEWQPVKVGSNWPMTVLLLLVLSTCSASNKRIPLVDRMLTVTLLLLALGNARHTIIMALLMMPYMTLQLSEKLYDSKASKRLRKTDAILMRDMQQKDIRIMTACMALAAILFIAVPALHTGLLKESTGFPKKIFPAADAVYIAKHYPNQRFFNDYNIGGYLNYIWRGKVKVFIDGRSSSLYSPELLQDYIDFTTSNGLGGRAEAIARYYRLDGLILPNEDIKPDNWDWNPHWKAVYRGDVVTVYQRIK